MENVDFARNNEEFAENIASDYPGQQNWVVTVRFYSYLHYVEERLQSCGYSSDTHKDRKENIRNCNAVDNKARKIYRFLEDISRDARYECHRMTEQEANKAKEKLEEGKDILGYSAGGADTDTKYST